MEKVLRSYAIDVLILFVFLVYAATLYVGKPHFETRDYELLLRFSLLWGAFRPVIYFRRVVRNESQIGEVALSRVSPREFLWLKLRIPLLIGVVPLLVCYLYEVVPGIYDEWQTHWRRYWEPFKNPVIASFACADLCAKLAKGKSRAVIGFRSFAWLLLLWVFPSVFWWPLLLMPLGGHGHWYWDFYLGGTVDLLFLIIATALLINRWRSVIKTIFVFT